MHYHPFSLGILGRDQLGTSTYIIFMTTALFLHIDSIYFMNFSFALLHAFVMIQMVMIGTQCKIMAGESFNPTLTNQVQCSSNLLVINIIIIKSLNLSIH